MSDMGAPMRFFQRFLLPALASLIILVALVFSLLRLALPWASHLRLEVAATLENYLDARVAIGRMDMAWAGLGPTLELADVALLDADGHPIQRLSALSLQIDLLDSLLQFDTRLSGIELHGAELHMVRESGVWRLSGLQEGGAPRAAPDASADTRQDAVRWLGRVQRLDILNSRLILEDRDAARQLNVPGIDIRLANHDDRHALSTRFRLPGLRAGSVVFTAQMTGDPGVAESLSGTGYLHLEGIDLAQLSSVLSGHLSWLPAVAEMTATNCVVVDPASCANPLPDFERGRLDLELWIDLADGHLSGGQARLDLGATRVRRTLSGGVPLAEVELPALSLEGALGVRGEDVQLELSRLVVGEGATAWPAQAVRFAREQGRWRVSVPYVDLALLDRLSDLWPLESDWTAPLRRYRPAGVLRGIVLDWPVDGPVDGSAEGGGDTGRAYARFESLAVRGAGALPSVSGASGAAWLGETGGIVHLDSPGLALDFHGAFSEPMRFSEASGVVYLRSPREEGSGWRLFTPRLDIANADIRLRTRFDLLLPGAPSEEAVTGPLIRLEGEFENARADRVPAYLPRHEMAADALQWLDRALPGSGGQVPAGRMVLVGDLLRFPFDHGGGYFETRFDFHSLNLDYQAGWPRAEALAGEIAFIGNGMNARIDAGQVRGVSVHGGEVYIPDFNQAALDAGLTLQGPLSGVLDFLSDSPILGGREALEGLSAEGDVSARLAIHLPLYVGLGPERVEGWVAFSGNRLNLPEGLHLDAVRGALHFVDDRFDAQGIDARLFGAPLALGVQTGDTPQGRATRIEGRMAAAPIEPLLGERLPWLVDRVHGTSELTARLTLPHRREQGRPAALDLELSSSLTGVEIALPAPFGKPANEAAALDLRLHWGAGPLQSIALDYTRAEPLLQARLRMTPSGEGLAFGELRLGGAASEPTGSEADGLLVHGHLARLVPQEWAFLGADPGEVGQRKADRLPVRMQLAIDRLALGALALEDARLNARAGRDGAWAVEVESAALAGRIDLPAAGASDSTVHVDLSRWHLPREEKGHSLPADKLPPPDRDTDPRTLPPLVFRCADFVAGEYHLGRVDLSGAPDAEGWKIAHLALAGPGYTVSGEGRWTHRAEGGSESRLSLRPQSEDFGAALRAINNTQALEGGSLREARVELSWEGGPQDFAVARLRGEGGFELDNGQLRDVDTGNAGRLLSLFSLGALPRRLTLDFRDVFGKGLSFDTVSARFSLADGRLRSNPVILRSASMMLELNGEADLIRDVLDYRLGVHTDMSAVLPVLGTVAGGPVVGGAVLLAQTLFGQLNKGQPSTPTFEYRITGPIDNPVMETVK